MTWLALFSITDPGRGTGGFIVKLSRRYGFTSSG